MKKLTFLLFIMTILMLTVCVSSAEVPSDENGQYIYVTYPDGAQSEKLYLRKDLIGTYEVYGQPEQVIGATPPQLYDDAQGQWRYFGYSRTGVPFSNPAFRSDPGSFPVTEREYIQNPEGRAGSGCAFIGKYINEEDWPSIYSQIQQYAISQGYPADAFWNDMSYYGAVASSMNGNKGMLKVLFYRRGDPPTEWRYESIPDLIVKIPDYYAEFTGSIPQEFSPGQKIDLSVKFGQRANVDSSVVNAPLRVYLIYAGKQELIYTKDLPYGAGQSDIVGVSFTAPDAQSVTIRGVINQYDFNGNFGIIETDYNNNICDKVLSRVADSSPGSPQEGLPDPNPPQPTGSSNLKADSIELLNKDMTPHSGDTVVNTPYKVRAKFTSTFNEGGWVKLRLYSWKEAGWMDEKISEYIYMQPNQSIEKVWDYNGGLGKTMLYSSINYRYGDSWMGEPYNGVMEADYSDNYCSLNRAGAGITDNGPPVATGFEYSLYYHPMRIHEEPIIEKQPVYGWVMVDFIKSDEIEYSVKARLRE